MSQRGMIISIAPKLLPECAEIHATFAINDDMDIRLIARKYATSCFGPGPFIFATFPQTTSCVDINKRMEELWMQYKN